MLYYVVAIVAVIVVGFVLFAFYKHLDPEDKSMAGSLTTGVFALVAAIIAWYFVQQQIKNTQQQVNIALADMLARRVTQLEDIHQRLDKMHTDLMSANLELLNPVFFN
jgi:hypothetical protein